MKDMSPPIARPVDRINLPQAYGDLAALARFLSSPAAVETLEAIMEQSRAVNDGLTASERLTAADARFAEAEAALSAAKEAQSAAEELERSATASFSQKKTEADGILKAASDDAAAIVEAAREEAKSILDEAAATAARAEAQRLAALQKAVDAEEAQEQAARTKREFERRLAIMQQAAGDLDGDGMPDAPPQDGG